MPKYDKRAFPPFVSLFFFFFFTAATACLSVVSDGGKARITTGRAKQDASTCIDWTAVPATRELIWDRADFILYSKVAHYIYSVLIYASIPLICAGVIYTRAFLSALFLRAF